MTEDADQQVQTLPYRMDFLISGSTLPVFEDEITYVMKAGSLGGTMERE